MHTHTHMTHADPSLDSENMCISGLSDLSQENTPFLGNAEFSTFE